MVAAVFHANYLKFHIDLLNVLLRPTDKLQSSSTVPLFENVMSSLPRSTVLRFFIFRFHLCNNAISGRRRHGVQAHGPR
jgi:hypothetical protein